MYNVLYIALHWRYLLLLFLISSTKYSWNKVTIQTVLRVFSSSLKLHQHFHQWYGFHHEFMNHEQNWLPIFWTNSDCITNHLLILTDTVQILMSIVISFRCNKDATNSVNRLLSCGVSLNPNNFLHFLNFSTFRTENLSLKFTIVYFCCLPYMSLDF